MARQRGIIKLQGTIGDISFYKSKDGYLAREKGGVDASRIANDPAFVRTRENGAEFGRAGNAGKVLRNALRELLQFADSRVTSRLTQEMVRVVQADSTSVRGLRNVLDGELELLTGFNFNINAKLGSTIYVPFEAVLDRVTGLAGVNFPDYVAADSIFSPPGATTYRIIVGGCEIDFETGAFTTRTTSSGYLLLSSSTTPADSYTMLVPGGSTKPLFLLLGIEFYQQVNGQRYTLKNGAYNALSLVKISGGV